MARGKPALWSAVLGLPFVGAGAWLYTGQETYPPDVGIPFVLFGAFVVLVGAYVHFVSPSAPRLSDGEEILETRHPTQRVARVKVAAGIPLLALTVYLLYFTYYPYVYPTLTLVVGLYLFSVGIHTYWTNSLTTYYVTTNRIIKEYRFVSLVRQEIPRSKIRGVQERKSITESLVGLGNVMVASGGGHSLEIRMRNMEQSGSFADSIRNLVSE
ncbi:PH domain-containing protein [Haloferax sp. MBLA0076]|uniref:PH domain-containing protein n=1 Tax=Haloferax litoreum TaxID=2666140 RepID=A0A6A8GE77_9EURY|nr:MULTISPECIES: PH domain-containing protein [Haloferax]KAB1193188.1 PH domain-containing protein [Haloferax sp. CBA1148]MRX21684.1 PH domain-containing protein [Haloferax litoreum]